MKVPTLAGLTIVALNGCSSPRQPLTEAAFQAARRECGAQDAYVMNTPDGKIITFKGLALIHTEQAKCLAEKLRGTSASIAFISEPPGQ